MKRFPVRAVRELAAEGGTDLLDGHVRGNLDVIKAALPLLPEDARAAVEQITEDLDATTDADPADLPAVLADPPWARKRNGWNRWSSRGFPLRNRPSRGPGTGATPGVSGRCPSPTDGAVTARCADRGRDGSPTSKRAG